MAQQTDPDDLLDDLARLRKNDGFTAKHLADSPMVEHLLREKDSDEFGRLRSRFVSAVYSLEDRDAALLLNIYGLSDETRELPRLGDRRAVHAAKIHRGVDTVYNLEPGAIGRLASRLIHGTYAQSPLLIDVPEMHGGIIYEQTSTLIIVENRLWKRTIEHYRFVATFDEMDYLTVTRSYAARASVPADGAFRLNTRPTSQGFNDHFWHRDRNGNDSPMRRGEMYDLKFVLEPEEPVEEQEPIVNAYRAFHERSLLTSIQVAFIGERPTVVWKYERVSHFAQPGVPSDSSQMASDERGFVTLRLRDQWGGLASGFAWIWASSG